MIMKVKFLVIAMGLLFVSATANAQEKVNSLTIGFSPLGATHINMKQKDNDMKYSSNYNSNWNVNIGYERQFEGVVSLTELTYFQAKWDETTYTHKDHDYPVLTGEDIWSAGITTYIGTTINAKKRFQLPLYIGVGGEYIDGNGLHNVMLDLAAKARMKFYITSSIGIYAGFTYRYGFGSHEQKLDDEESNSDSKLYWGISPSTWAVDAGLVIGL